MMQAMSPLPPLADVLSQLDQWYATHLPAVWKTLRPGVSDADLDAFEARTALHLPAAFRTLYRWHDGQDWSVGGVLGLAFMPLAEVEFASMMWRDIAEGDGADINIDIYVVSHPTGAIREQYASPWVVPFLSDGGGNAVALDLAPDLCGQPGQVITTGRDQTHRYVLAPDLETFLREYLTRLEAGQVTVQALSGYEGEMWASELHDAAGPRGEGYFRLADLYPGFGAAPSRVLPPAPEENDPPPLEQALLRLDAWLHLHHPELLDTLSPGASEEELRAAERRLGRALPEEVRVLYRQHRDWGDLLGARSIPVDELGRAGPTTFGEADRRGNLHPFNPYVPPSTPQDWLPLWEAEVGLIGVNLARYGEVRTFGEQVAVRYVLAENLARLFDRYVRLLEAGLLRRAGTSLRVPDAAGHLGSGRAEQLFPGFGASPPLVVSSS